MFDLPVDHLVPEREHFVVSLHVVEVDVVHAAPADVVVGMVLEQGIPRRLEQRRLDARQAAHARPRGQRLDHAGEQRLRAVVENLEIDPCREHVPQERMIGLAEEIPVVHGKRLPLRRPAELGHVVLEAAEPEPDVGLAGVEIIDQRCQVAAGGKMIPAGGQHHDRVLLEGHDPRERRAQPLAGSFLARGQAVVASMKTLLPEGPERKVALPQKRGQHLRPVGGTPREDGPVAIADLDGHAAHEQEGVDAEAGKDLRQLGEMPERVGHVADFRGAAVLDGDAQAALQVADQRLGAGQEAIRHRVPRPKLQSPRLDEAADPRPVLRPDREMILENHRLAVEDEVRQGVRLEQVEQVGHHLDEPQAIGLERQVPRPIPVRVGNDDSDAVRAHGRWTLVRRGLVFLRAGWHGIARLTAGATLNTNLA